MSGITQKKSVEDFALKSITLTELNRILIRIGQLVSQAHGIGQNADLHGSQIVNVGNPTRDKDAINKESLDDGLEPKTTGPDTSTDNAVVRFDGITGKVLQNSQATIDDDGTVNIPTGETYNIDGTPHSHTIDGLSDVVTTSEEQGDQLYRNGTEWVNAHHGAAGDVWTSGGHGANPSWEVPVNTSPGGSDTQVQYNDSGAFGGDSGLTYDPDTDTLYIGGKVGVGEAPLAVGHFKGTDAGAIQVFIKNANGGTGCSAELVFGTYTSAIPTGSGNPGPQGKIACINTDVGSAYSDLVFYTYGGAEGAVLTERFRITNAGKFGLLTAAPSYDVSIGGNAERTVGLERHTTSNTAGNNLLVLAGGAKALATDKNGGDLLLKGGIATGTGSSNIKLYTAPADSGTGTGDRDPTLKLVVAGSGWIGQGVETPLAKYHLEGSVAGALQAFIRNSNGDTNSSADIVFGVYSGAIPTGAGNPGPSAKISAVNTDSGSATTDLVFYTYAGGVLSEVFRLGSDGSIDIPTGKTYDINGTPHGHAVSDLTGTMVYRLASVNGIDAKTVAQTTLYTVPAGKSLVIERIVIRCTAFTVGSKSVQAVASFGGNASTYDDYLNSVTYTISAANTAIVDSVRDSAFPVYAAGTVIKLAVETGSNATTETWAVDLFGYLI